MPSNGLAMSISTANGGRDKFYWQRLQRTIATMTLPAFLLLELDDNGQSGNKEKKFILSCRNSAAALAKQTRGRFRQLHRLARQCNEVCRKTKLTQQERNIVKRFLVSARLYRCWRYLEKARKLAPQVAHYHFETAFVLQNMGEYGRAYRYWQQAQKMRPRPIYNLAAAQLEYRRDRFSEAEKFVDQLRQNHVNDPSVWQIQGRIHLARKEWKQAAQSFWRQHFVEPERITSLLLLTNAHLHCENQRYRRQTSQLITMLSPILEKNTRQINQELAPLLPEIKKIRNRLTDAVCLTNAWQGPHYELFLRQADNQRNKGLLYFVQVQSQLLGNNPIDQEKVLELCIRGNESFANHVIYYPMTPFARKKLAHYHQNLFADLLRRQRMQIYVPLEIIGLTEYH